MIIAVIGAGECSREVAEMAEEVGHRLAEKGAILICGGLGGVMEAACRGAKSAGGTTVGVLPGTNPGDVNPYVDIPIATGMGQARNVIVVTSAQAVIAIGGGYGTLSEIGHAKKLGLPVVGLQTWSLAQEGYEGLARAETPAEAVEKALALAKRYDIRGSSRGR